MILDPTGTAISEPLSDSEGIVYAEIDASRSVEPEQFHNLTGHWTKPLRGIPVLRRPLSARPAFCIAEELC
jgi:aliphatic nitrilase